jgi:hypothetical protein
MVHRAKKRKGLLPNCMMIYSVDELRVENNRKDTES